MSDPDKEFYKDYPHAEAEDALINYLQGAINRGSIEWQLTAPQVLGCLELIKQRVWAQFDEVPSGTREDE